MAALGRPRAFDREEALKQALLIFWEKGYEGTSVTDLTATLGIGAPSLYAAFGDKKTLFREAIDLYYGQFVAFIDSILGAAADTRTAISEVLLTVAGFYTSPGQPRGCLVNTAAPPAGDDEVEAYLRELRSSIRQRLEDRIRRGQAEGELPATTDVVGLAELYWATVLGMSMLSRDGASRSQLEQVALKVLAIWPEESRVDA